jgi:glutamine amidotransferase
MGWNLVELPEDMDLFAGLGPAKHFYFANSYHAQMSDPETRTATVDYGSPLTASVQKGNIYGVQFHPEKSSRQGLQVLKNFHDICAKHGVA